LAEATPAWVKTSANAAWSRGSGVAAAALGVGCGGGLRSRPHAAKATNAPVSATRATEQRTASA
jgi:hypothetical protein